MLKFIRGKGQQPSAERQKLQRELFAFRKTIQHGFPNKPTALAWDPVLRLLAIGTATGVLKIVGRPGVEMYAQHVGTDAASVTRLVFVPGQGRVIALLDDNSLHLWEVTPESQLVLKLSHTLEGKLKRISSMCLESALDHLLLGTEGGNIYLLDIKTFQLSETIIYQDVVMQNVPEDYKINPGAVECIAEQPGHPDKILIGYNRGLMVLWDRVTPGAQQTFVSTQQLESVCWHRSGEKFASSHNDGSFAYWDVTVGDKPMEEPTTLYGPFPCKAVTKFLWRHDKDSDWVLFSGGMPRASYSDKHTVTVQHNDKHVVFDFTSKVIDFFTIAVDYLDPDHDAPDCVMVLLEEELVCVDLSQAEWRPVQLPYLVSLHASAVTTAQHVADVPDKLWQEMIAAGEMQNKDLYADRAWPVDGGSCPDEEELRDVLLTGHEDGTVRLWRAGSAALRPLLRFSTAPLFTGDDVPLPGDDEEREEDADDEWPPFNKVGWFDPYSDDPRLAVKRAALCPYTGTLAVAGTAGSVVVARFSAEATSAELRVTTADIVLDRDGFVWKGHEKLAPKQGQIKLGAGFQPSAVLQLHPPAAVTALALHTEWGVLAAGTAHGLAVFDYCRHQSVLTKCTLNPNDLSGSGDAPISRRKSFKKSLRESFRRLRKGRSGRRGPTPEAAPSPAPAPGPATAAEARPVERSVEARPVDDSLGSMVRCVYFAKTFILSVQYLTGSLWVGTNAGSVLVFTVSVPAAPKRLDDPVGCQLAKEIQLKHRAPVIAVAVVDGANQALAEPSAPARPVAPPHRVIIGSEEQFKMFTLPGLKPLGKLKLTAHEGSRLRRMQLVEFTAGQHKETCLVALTNIGDCFVLSVPDLRRQMNADVVRREDINGISSLVFTSRAETLHLHSSSELQRCTLSAGAGLAAHGTVTLPAGARAVEPEPQPEPHEEEKMEEEVEEKEEEEKEEVVEVNGVDHDHTPGLHVSFHFPAESAEPRENGTSTDDMNDLSMSVGDITVDSVKEHLLSNSVIVTSSDTVEVKTLSEKSEVVKSEVVKTTVISTSGNVTAAAADS